MREENTDTETRFGALKCTTARAVHVDVRQYKKLGFLCARGCRRGEVSERERKRVRWHASLLSAVVALFLSSCVLVICSVWCRAASLSLLSVGLFAATDKREKTDSPTHTFYAMHSRLALVGWLVGCALSLSVCGHSVLVLAYSYRYTSSLSPSSSSPPLPTRSLRVQEVVGRPACCVAPPAAATDAARGRWVGGWWVGEM